MARTRRRFDGNFKAKVALEAIRGLKTISEIAKQFKVHPNQVTTWKKQLLGGASQVFEDGSVSSKKESDEPQAAELYEQIGRLKVELEWLKKKFPRTREESLKWIDRDHDSLSVRRQCQILGIHRSQLYYEPVGESGENLELMRLIDEQYLKTPFWGSRNMAVFLSKRIGKSVNRKKTCVELPQARPSSSFPSRRLAFACGKWVLREWLPAHQPADRTAVTRSIRTC